MLLRRGRLFPRLDAFSSVDSEFFSFFHVHVFLGPDPFLPGTTDRLRCRTLCFVATSALLRTLQTALLTTLRLSFLCLFFVHCLFLVHCSFLCFSILSSFVITSFLLASLSSLDSTLDSLALLFCFVIKHKIYIYDFCYLLGPLANPIEGPL